MKITSIKNVSNNYVNFKSGISKKEITQLGNVPIKSINDAFFKNGVEVDFKNNQTIAVLNLLCRDVLAKLSDSKTFMGLDFSLTPKKIKTFNSNQTTKRTAEFFCNITTNKILKTEISAPNTMFYKNNSYTIKQMNDMTECAKEQGIISTSNFLSYFMHEWAHSLHLSYLYKTLGKNEDEVLEIMRNLKKIELLPHEKEMIEQLLGAYVYNGGKIHGAEVFAEGLNKIICSCLDDRKIMFVQDIDTSADKLPKEFIALLQKILYQADKQ